jgi:hypothetical protein
MAEPPETPDSAGAAEDGALVMPRSFLVRVRRAASGAVTGVVEAVRTGEKRPFEGTGAIGPVIDTMLDLPDTPLPGGDDA